MFIKHLSKCFLCIFLFSAKVCYSVEYYQAFRCRELMDGPGSTTTLKRKFPERSSGHWSAHVEPFRRLWAAIHPLVCDVHPPFLNSAVLNSRTVLKLVCRHSFGPKTISWEMKELGFNASRRWRLCPMNVCMLMDAG